MSARLSGVSPAAVARGLIAACAHFRVTPTEVMTAGPGSSARIALGAALLAILPRTSLKDGATQAVSHMLQLPSTSLAPSALRLRNIDTDLILDLAEVLKAAGLVPAEMAIVKVVAAPPAPKLPTPRRMAPVKPAAPAALPLKANVQRWTGQFLRAGWSPREVAKLFDLDVSQLQAIKLQTSAAA